MSKAYWINTFRSVSDPQRLAAYIELGRLGDGGLRRQIPRPRPLVTFESGVMERTILIEFESAERAREAYLSPRYQAAIRALGDGAERDIRIVEALA